MTESAAPILDRGDNVRRISNSEAQTWLACRMKYYYEFDLELEPIKRGTALGRGILLHEVMAHYYTSLKEQVPHAEAERRATAFLSSFIGSPAYDLEVVLEVKKMLAGYWAYYQGDPDWEILEVEQTRDLPLTPEFEFPLRFDLYIRERRTGKLALVDHKTCYNFWTQDEINFWAQFPKYIGSMRANQHDVDKVIINQLRTRPIKDPSPDKLFKRDDAMPSRAKIANALREHILVSQEITKHRNLPLEVRQGTATRALNKMICNNCDVSPLCMSEMDGGDITTAIASDYQKRTYGYNDDTEIKAL